MILEFIINKAMPDDPISFKLEFSSNSGLCHVDLCTNMEAGLVGGTDRCQLLSDWT